jgi:Rps23 Pro-64 3,4-dihydroxylase Tpa1-like proline 4-hydroxylase
MEQTTLKKMAIECAEKITLAKEGSEYFDDPFKHIVIDNFLEVNFATQCMNHFPTLEDSTWEFQNDTDIEVKYRSTWQSEFDIPNIIVDAVRIFNSSILLKSISKRIGIEKLIPDPYFTGGGLNVSKRNGLLDVHVDGNYHDATGLNRRLNALLYLNPNWKDDWGGEFGLYDNSGKRCVKKIPPLFNRLVIFDSHDFSFHGLPEPINFPSDENRKSIILYYYTKQSRPQNQIKVTEPHSALWVKRDLLDKAGNKQRKFT